MKRFATTALLALAAAGAVPVALAAPPASDALVQDKQCYQCHAVARDGAGPSFRKIAARWRGQKDAEARLMATVLGGSPGKPHWNKATMPDQSERPQVSEDQARQLVKWVLSQ